MAQGVTNYHHPKVELIPPIFTGGIPNPNHIPLLVNGPRIDSKARFFINPYP